MKKEKVIKVPKEKREVLPNDDAKFEREDVLLSSDGDKRWHLDSFRRTTITKMQRIGQEPVYVNEKSGEHRYILDSNQVSFRKKTAGKTKRIMTDEQKRSAAERFKAAREAKKNK